MKQDKILIVDDQPAELDMMKDILDCDRYAIVAVGSGEEALQIANQGFDLLLTDIVMPHMEGLELIKEDITLIAVHDAVRCCLKNEWIDDCFAAAAGTGAAMLAAPVVATIKKVKDGIIEKTVDRAGLYEAQTPQVFKKELLKKAYAELSKLDKTKISDDAQLVEALGEKVAIVETDSSNLKITTPADIAIAEAIIKSRPKPKQQGYLGPYGDAQW